MGQFFADSMFVLFLILALGTVLGSLSWRGIALGTAGVLFVALVFGHFGFSIPKVIMELGLLLFVYAVGLQAGPRFFRTFKKQGLRFAVIGLSVALTGAFLTFVLALLLNLSDDLAAGLYTGALTCTPALAGALDVFARFAPDLQGTVSVGYGIAYPFSMIGIVILVQFFPRLVRANLRLEEQQWLEERRRELPMLVVKQYRITNPNMEGRTLRELHPHRLAHVNITRVFRNGQVSLVYPDFSFRQGDVIMAVGPQPEMEKIELLFGEEAHVPMDMNTNIATADLEVTSTAVAGKTLAELRVWENYGVVITRIRRQGMEISPIGSMTLEIGDGLHIVGERMDVDKFVKEIGGDTRRIHETSMLSYLLGLVLGIGLGLLPFQLPGGVQVKLGAAGGAFLVSLLIGHFGRLGRLPLYVPAAAKNLTRELGLMLFLAGAGTNAGAHFVSVIQEQGWTLFLAGAMITIVSTTAGLVTMIKIFRMKTLASLGALTACMTNPPGLASANTHTTTDLATLSYASVYPAALIFKILAAQLLSILLLRF
ncbi:MAG: hypothetical protein N2049_03375 [Anaerolineales bacterium]|nr:hypothetical protein [Anaerolineales bacterium]